MAENNWKLQDGRSIHVDFNAPAGAGSWTLQDGRSINVSFESPAAQWANHAWLRGGQMVQAAQSGGQTGSGASASRLVARGMAIGTKSSSHSSAVRNRPIGITVHSKLAASGAIASHILFRTDQHSPKTGYDVSASRLIARGLSIGAKSSTHSSAARNRQISITVHSKITASGAVALRIWSVTSAEYQKTGQDISALQLIAHAAAIGAKANSDGAAARNRPIGIAAHSKIAASGAMARLLILSSINTEIRNLSNTFARLRLASFSTGGKINEAGIAARTGRIIQGSTSGKISSAGILALLSARTSIISGSQFIPPSPIVGGNWFGRWLGRWFGGWFGKLRGLIAAAVPADAVKILRYLLAHHPALIAVVPAARIKAGVIPLNSALPAISVLEISSNERRTVSMTSSQALITSRVQVTVLCGSLREQKSILALIIQACANWNGSINGMMVDSILPDLTGPDLEDAEAGLYAQSKDFIVRFFVDIT